MLDSFRGERLGAVTGRPLHLALLVVAVAALSTAVCCYAQLSSPFARAEDYFNPTEIAQGASLNSQLRVLFFAAFGLKAIILLLILTSRAGMQYRLWSAMSARGRYWVMTMLMAFGTYVLVRLGVLPLDFYRGYLLPHRYSLSTQPMLSWMTEWFLIQLSHLVAFVAICCLVYRFIGWNARHWWLPTGLILCILGTGYYWVAPISVDCLFNEFRPLEDEILERSIRKLMSRYQVPLEEILVMDASSRGNYLNAYYTGLFGTRRIVLYDTVLEQLDRKATLSLVAHEIGHWHHDHVLKGLALACLGGLLALAFTARILDKAIRKLWFGLSEAVDPATLPIVLLTLHVLATFVILPIGCIVSRHFEAQADAFCLEATADPAAFIALEREMCHSNLEEIVPPQWAIHFHTHPPVLSRISHALRYQATMETPSPQVSIVQEGSTASDKAKATP